MLAVAQNTPTVEVEASERTTITTTLFDLIAALNDQVKPGEEDVVTAAVVHLCQTGRLRFLRGPQTYTAACA